MSQTVSFTFTVDRPRDEVHALIEDLAAHERWCDHFMTDWRIDGDPRAVGAVLHTRAKPAGRHPDIELTVVASTPDGSAEISRSGKHLKRRLSGVYELRSVGEDRTEISFTNEVLEFANPLERLAAPLVRAVLRKQSGRAMDRLAAILGGRLDVCVEDDDPARSYSSAG